MVRPEPLLGRVQGHMIVYRGGRRRFAQARKQALSDGVMDLREAKALLQIAEQEVFVGGDNLVRDGGLLCTSVRHVTQVLTGANGMDSECAQRSWDERQAARSWEDGDDSPPAAPKAA